MEAKKRSALSTRGGHVKGVARRWLKRGGGGGGGLKGARGGGRGPGYSLSVHKRATVHTPKRVFVRFHFTPNYLAHIGAHTVGEGGGEGDGKTRRRDKRCVARRCGVKIHRNVGEGGRHRRMYRITPRIVRLPWILFYAQLLRRVDIYVYIYVRG